MITHMKQPLFLLPALLLISLSSWADEFISIVQLQEAFQKVNDSWDIEIVEEIKHYQDFQRVTVTDREGYSSGLKFKVRAQMFPDRVRDTVEVFGLAATAYFPRNPQTHPLIIQHRSVKVHNQVQASVLDSAEVKVPFNGMSGKKSKWIVYGQTVLKNTETTATAIDNHFIVESKIDISGMSVKKAKKYFESFQGLVSSLNAELQKMDNVEMAKWYDKQTDIAAAEFDALAKKNYTSITDKDVFMRLAGWQLNADNQMEEPVSELGHWSYENVDAHDDYNVTVEVINYGDYFEMVYLVSYDESLDENEEALNAMIAKISKYVSSKVPKGAKSATARTTDYYGVAEVVAVYSLESNPTGRQIYKNADKFDKFVVKTFKKSQKIADKAS